MIVLSQERNQNARPNAVRVRAEPCWPEAASCACSSSFLGRCDEGAFRHGGLGWMLLLDRPRSSPQQERAQPGPALFQLIRGERDVMDHDDELVGYSHPSIAHMATHIEGIMCIAM